MSIPDNLLTDDRPESPLLTPDNLERVDPRRDWERGGVALSDPTQGLNVRDWTCWTDGLSIWVAPYPEQAPMVEVLTGSGITEVSLAFDQNMGPNVAYVEDGTCKLWWYDSALPGMTTTDFPGCRSPMLTMDDKRDKATNNGQNDIIFAYVRDGQLCWRQQRDRYTIERVLGAVPSASSRIVGMGMAENNRLQVKIASAANGAYVDISSGDMFIADGEDILQVDVGADQTTVWRSRVYVFDAQPSFAWARVEAEGPVSFKVFADGALLFTKAVVADNRAFRLPPKKAREWFVELSGTSRVVSVALASSTAELGR